MNAQDIAVRMEHLISYTFDMKRNEFGGLISADRIRYNPYFSMLFTVMNLYLSANEDFRKEIEDFSKSIIQYAELKSIDDILEKKFDFESSFVKFKEICKKAKKS